LLELDKNKSMNPAVFKIVLVIHIIAGSTGLLAGTVAMAARKASKLHKRMGKVFFFAMAGVFVSSLYMSIVKNSIFLLLIGFFSFYLASTGYRILFLKKLATQKIKPQAVDYLIGLVGILGGLAMFTYAAYLFTHGSQFGIVFLAFGIISLGLGFLDIRKFSSPPTNKMHWVTSHGLRMGGAYGATITAFVVVNIQIEQQWILWLLPPVIVIPLAKRLVDNFVKPKKQDT
jgi:uncharacterized membrane protein